MKRKLIILTIVLLSTVLVIGIAAEILGRYYVKPIVGERINYLIENGSDGLYQFDYENIKLSIWNGSFSIHNASITVDSSAFSDANAHEALPSVTFGIHMQDGHISGMNYWRFLLKKEISVSKVFTQDASISLYRHYAGTTPNQPDSTRETKELWQIIKPYFNKLAIKEIEFKDVDFHFRNRDSNRVFKMDLEKVYTKISDIEIDSLSYINPDKMFYMGDIEVRLSRFGLKSADSLYKMELGELYYSMRKHVVELTDFSYSPSLSYADFYKVTKMEKDVYTLKFPSVRLAGINPRIFLAQNILMMDSLLLSDADIEIYHDRNPPDDMVSKIGKFPHQQLLKVPVQIYIGNATGKNIRVSYSEKSDETHQIGTLVFSEINGLAKHITNMPEHIAEHPILTIAVSGLFMEKTPIEGKFGLNLTETDGTFEVEGEIAPSDLRMLNPITEALASARFVNMKTGKAHVKIKGNEYAAYCSLNVPYNDLHLELLNNKTENHSAQKALSAVVKMFLHNHNPGNNGVLRNAHNVKEARHPQRSFFNLIWKSIFAAAKEITMKEGVKKIEQKRQLKKAEKNMK